MKIKENTINFVSCIGQAAKAEHGYKGSFAILMDIEHLFYEGTHLNEGESGNYLSLEMTPLEFSEIEDTLDDTLEEAGYNPITSDTMVILFDADCRILQTQRF